MNLIHSIKSITLAAGLLAMSAAAASAQVYNWTTIAGIAGGSTDGTNASALFYQPYGVAVDANGVLYVADSGNYTIRKITPSGTNWVVTTIAGQAGNRGSADGRNNTAQFYYPRGIAVDSEGNILVTDVYTIRKITPAGADWVVTTIAGLSGSSGNVDGTNSSARFNGIGGITVDGAGNLYVTDTYTIRKVTLAGTNWVVSTIAGLAQNTGTNDGTNGDARFYYPSGITTDSGGNVYVADTDNHAIRKLAPLGTNWVVTTIAGQAGSIGTTDGTNSAAKFYHPAGLVADQAGSLYVADAYNDTIRRLTPAETNWVVTTLAGKAGWAGSADGTNSAARFYTPSGLGADKAGNIYVADTSNYMIRELMPAGTNWVVSTLAGITGSGSADGTNSSIRFHQPGGIAVDSRDTVYVGDTGNCTIRKLTPVGSDWVSSTMSDAGFCGTYGIAVDSAGSCYVAANDTAAIRKLAPVGTNWVVSTIAGLVTSPGVADGTNSAARFESPNGVGVDGGGNVYVADQGANTIRKLTPVGTNWVVTTIAGWAGHAGIADGTNASAQFAYPSGVVPDAAGNLYVSDQDNNTIRKIAPVRTNWVVTTIAGRAGYSGRADGTNRDARFNWPGGLAVDSGGNIYVADFFNSTVRKIVPVRTNWVVSTIGGLGTSPGRSDGTNSAARFSGPNGVAVDGWGNVFVADLENNTIRRGAPLPVFQAPMPTVGAFNLVWSAAPGQTFQVQFKTNLAQPDWINLGGPSAGTNGAAGASDLLPPDPQRFYRVILMP